jgi:hypothetical protein
VRVRSGPALLIVGIVLVITVGGGLLAVLGSSPKTTSASLAAPPGMSLDAARAAPLIASIGSGGEPPSDITAALVVPADARLTAHHVSDAGIDLFDGTVDLSTSASRTAVVAFYRYELKHLGWDITLVTASATGSGTQIYALHPSADGYTWEVGVLVEDANGAISSALGGDAAPRPTSSVALRLIERDDAD